jgi:hypothetical protein
VGEGDAEERTRRLHAMETSTDPVYGAGLRDALAAYHACGSSLQRLLQRVKDGGGTLPRAGGTAAELWAKRPGRAWQGCAGAFRDATRPDTRQRAREFDESRRAAAAALRPATSL